MQKWQRAGVSHVVGVDIAATSIEQCKDRSENRNMNKDKIVKYLKVPRDEGKE